MTLKPFSRPVFGAALALFTLASPLALAEAPAQPAKPQAPVAPVAPQQTQQQPQSQQQRPRIDVVFVLDTTGSMGGLIEGAKQKIFSIASGRTPGPSSSTMLSISLR